MFLPKKEKNGEEGSFQWQKKMADISYCVCANNQIPPAPGPDLPLQTRSRFRPYVTLSAFNSYIPLLALRASELVVVDAPSCLGVSDD